MARYADTTLYTDAEHKMWERLTEQRGKTYYTAKGLPFTFDIRGNEIIFSRKEKSITRATVNRAYKRMVKEDISGSKQLGVFGASYLFPVLKDIIAKT